MRTRLLSLSLPAALLILPLAAQEASGQLIDRLKRTARNAAESELNRKVDQVTRDAVRCALGDQRCEERARADGKDVVFTDDRGEIIADKDGVPITDAAAASAAAAAAAGKPGEGVWANYDFVPGDRVLFYDDYSADVVGDFPRRMEFVSGNWEVVDWQGRRLLRNVGPRHSALKIPLPKTLPEHFTIEFDAYFPHTNWQLVVATSPPARNNNWTGLDGHFFRVGAAHGTGVETRARNGSRSVNRTSELATGLTPVRIVVDGKHARVYVNERRVGNIPNAEFPRTGELWVENIYSASEEQPLYLGPVRVAEGGTDLYRKLADEGRVATHGILFAVNSATIRPESTPTLVEIGAMLKQHPELRIRIEGHTDSTGEDAFNQQLSERRAAAVRTHLVESYGIDAARLESVGFGETKPAGDNATPEGRQNNRRVELVKLD